jgi:hypothetical protein
VFLRTVDSDLQDYATYIVEDMSIVTTVELSSHNQLNSFAVAELAPVFEGRLQPKAIAQKTKSSGKLTYCD